ncbi:MAG: hypothetical protein QE278_12425 [Limnobacter sp.]|nr:hypothetical protein [Limnobacter sp.]
MRWISVIYSASHPQAEAILKTCQQFTPKVYTQVDRFETPVEGSDTPIRYQGLLLEVHSSLRLFGGLQRLMQLLREKLNSLCRKAPHANTLLDLNLAAQHNITFKLGNASTAWMAWCMAKLQPCEQLALKDLPVHVLDLSMPDRQLMMQCGFETLGDLMKQSRSELAKRFGLSLLQQFDLLSGTQVWANSSHAELDVYEDQEEMPFHATDQSRIEELIYLLLCRLQTGLLQTKRKAERLDFLFVQAHGVIPMHIISAHGLQHAKDWALLIHYQLSRMQFQDDVRWIKLRCENLIPAFDHNGTWLPDPNTDKKQWIELCDKLKARLGEDVVKRAYTIPDPRPELSFEYRPFNANGKYQGSKAQSGKAQTGIVRTNLRLAKSALRPLWLLPEPQRLRGKAPSWTDGGEWRLLSGPERVDFGWWSKQPCKRDYYRALNKDMTQAWIFCEEEFHQEKTFINWFLHGYFG